jgi:alkylation response protein AidB-like acyl-CoA dehydrogenase
MFKFSVNVIFSGRHHGLNMNVIAKEQLPIVNHSIEATDRVLEYTRRFCKFLDRQVAPLEKELEAAKVGTPWNPHFDDRGRMHPTVWEARREVQRRAAAEKLYAPHVEVEIGGGGFSRTEMHHVEEYVYRNSGLGLGLAALAWTEGPNPTNIYMSKAVQERYLKPLMAGETTAAFANTETSVGSDVFGMSTYAKRDGKDWILNGRKAWITNSHYADMIQVTAVTDPGAGTRSLSMFIVDAKTPGFRHGIDYPTMLNDGLTGELEFDSVRLPAENVVGEIGDGFALSISFINWRRLCRGGMCSGWGQWLVDRAVKRAHERQAGGKPIADYQAVRHLIAEMDLNVYQARSTSLVGQSELDKLGAFNIPLHPEAPRLISLVKTINDESFYRVADNAIQVHGANGLALGSPEEKLFRIARNLRIPAGTTQIQYNAIASKLLRNAA